MVESELPQLVRVFMAFIFVMALMGGFVLILRKMGYVKAAMNSKSRLKLIEVLHLDSRRKLAIIQRDGRQHLVILGPSSETLVESFDESGQDAPHA
jgi:flagellar protein FliO/FliZ